MNQVSLFGRYAICAICHRRRPQNERDRTSRADVYFPRMKWDCKFGQIVFGKEYKCFNKHEEIEKGCSLSLSFFIRVIDEI